MAHHNATRIIYIEMLLDVNLDRSCNQHSDEFIDSVMSFSWQKHYSSLTLVEFKCSKREISIT